MILEPSDAITLKLSRARDAAAMLAKAHAAEQEARLVDQQVAELEQRKAELTAAAKQLQARLAELDLPDIGALEHGLAKTQERLELMRQTLAGARERLAVTDAELRRLDELADQVRGITDRVRQLADELELVGLCERAYGRDGIPTMIVENAAVPQIETEANRILAELGTSFTVELRTQRELKTGGVAESLDIIVVGPGGQARAYETFSGGERTRLNLALRIALARLLAHRRGAEVRVLVVDEPEFLDEPGVARLAEVLRGLSADFERTILISHQPALREAFDGVLTVVKTDGISAIAGVSEPEEALA
jgi:exonuclease SbcC